MKKILSLILINISIITYSQQINKPINPENNIGLIGGIYTQLNIRNYVEFGGLAGVNLKDITTLGIFYQRAINNEQFYGLYTQFNINPRTNYLNVGFIIRTGFINNKYLIIEPTIHIHKNITDKIKLTHEIGVTNGFFSYNIGLVYGNWGEKFWKN